MSLTFDVAAVRRQSEFLEPEDVLSRTMIAVAKYDLAGAETRILRYA